MTEEEKKALRVINARTRRLLNELEIEIEKEKEDMSDEPRIAYLIQEIRANKTILNLIEKLQKENKNLKADNLEYQRIQDISDARHYRRKYLEERRKEEPDLLYPDADEIYRRYYELKNELEITKKLQKRKKFVKFYIK